MVKEINKGNIRKNVSSPNMWQVMLHRLNRRIGRKFEMKQIKQKFNILRQQYETFFTCHDKLD